MKYLNVTVNVLFVLYCFLCKGKSPRQRKNPFDTVIIVNICNILNMLSEKWMGRRKESCLFTSYSHIKWKQPWSDLYKWCYCHMHRKVREWKNEIEQIEMLCKPRADMKQIWRMVGQHWGRRKTDLISR